MIELTAPIWYFDLKAASALTCLTTSWQSSNTPRTARLWMLASASEYICFLYAGDISEKNGIYA